MIENFPIVKSFIFNTFFAQGKILNLSDLVSIKTYARLLHHLHS